MSKILFCNPPAGSVWHLPPGIAYLAGYLKSKGHTVFQRYAHISAVESVLRKVNIAMNCTLHSIKVENRDADDTHTILLADKEIEETSARVPTKDYFRIERNNVKYISQHFDGTIKGALMAVCEKKAHLWYGYFMEHELPVAQTILPHVYGISIADEHQLIPGLILGSMIKRELRNTTVILGGNYWARITQQAYADPDFVRLFDICCHGIVYAEGYRPMEELLETGDPSKASGTIWLDKDHLVINPRTENPIDFESLPPPIFGRERQWLPYFTPTLYTASNCDRQCTFCACSKASDTYHQCPRRMSAAHIARDLQSIMKGYFHFAVDFGDESLPIDLQLELGRELRKIDFHPKWCCYMTVEERLLDLAVCKALHDAGLGMVQLGVESFSKETLRGEHKGWNKPENYGRIIRNLSEAGIHVHVFFIAAIPGEPLSDSLKLIRFLEDYGQWITTIKTGRYRLARGCPDEAQGRHLEHIDVLPDEWPLHLNRHTTYKGVSNKQVWAITSLLELVCRQHWAYDVTSRIHWGDRMKYSAKVMKDLTWKMKESVRLQVHPPIADHSIPDLKEVLAKLEAIVRKELGVEVSFNSYDDVKEFALSRKQ